MSLKLKTYASTASNISIVNYNLEKFTLRIVLWSFGVLALWYVFLLGNMVFNIIERRSLEAEARVLGNEVRDLELSYLALSNNIDLVFSQSLGFKEIEPKFATRKSLGSILNLKFVQNEI